MTILLIIIGISFLILVHEFGHFLSAKMFGVKVLEFGIGFPPKIFGKKIGETEYSINALPFGGFVRMEGEDGEEKGERSFASKKPWKRTIILFAGVFSHILLGWVILSVVLFAGKPFAPAISDVSPASPAYVAGIKSGDIILSVRSGGEFLSGEMKVDDFVNFIGSAEGSEIELTLKRGDETITKTLAGRENPPEGEGSLGLFLGEIGAEPLPFFQAIIQGAKDTWTMLALITVGFYKIITGIFISTDAIKDIAGPVGIVVIASDISSMGFIFFLQFLGLIALNLVILNLIPFPAFDGGRILMLLIEKISKRQIPEKVQSMINFAGLGLIAVLMVLVTYQDIMRFFS